MNTPPDYRSIALQNLAELALRRTALKEALAPFDTQIACIQKAMTDATAVEATAIERLEEDLKQLALAHGADIFGEDSRSLTHGLFMLALRTALKVEFAGDEDDVLSVLTKAAKSHPDEATRLAAASCVRVRTELNKPFIRENWDAFSAWFCVFGLNLVESESASITEKKPAKPKPSKPLKKTREEDLKTGEV